jgi:hypothetical protein
MGIIFLLVLFATVTPGALIGVLTGFCVGLVVSRENRQTYASYGLLAGGLCGLIVGGIIIHRMLAQVTWVH